MRSLSSRIQTVSFCATYEFCPGRAVRKSLQTFHEYLIRPPFLWQIHFHIILVATISSSTFHRFVVIFVVETQPPPHFFLLLKIRNINSLKSIWKTNYLSKMYSLLFSKVFSMPFLIISLISNTSTVSSKIAKCPTVFARCWLLLFFPHLEEVFSESIVIKF